jgi:hypothetical protein
MLLSIFIVILKIIGVLVGIILFLVLVGLINDWTKDFKYKPTPKKKNDFIYYHSGF